MNNFLRKKGNRFKMKALRATTTMIII